MKDTNDKNGAVSLVRDMKQPHAALIGKLAGLLTRCGYVMATAESCTGGMIAAMCTDMAGSSAWFKGGVVAYSNAIKEHLLGVPGAVLAQHGAVSGAVVRAMALGALHVCGVQAAVAVSGVAGPGGGSPEKPVGTVWSAVAMRETPGICAVDLASLCNTFPGALREEARDGTAVVYTVCRRFAGARAAVRAQAAEETLRDMTNLLELAVTVPPQ